MSVGMHDHGKEYLQRVGYNDLSVVSSISVGLFNNSTDSVSETSVLSDITTEPTGASYSRKSVSLAGDLTFSQDTNNDIVVEASDQAFDTSDSTQSVDAYFVVVNFAPTIVSDDSGTDTDHLFFTNALGDTVDLSSWNQFTARDIKGTLQRP